MKLLLQILFTATASAAFVLSAYFTGKGECIAAGFFAAIGIRVSITLAKKYL